MGKIKRAEVVEVVRVLLSEGDGTENSPVRLVEQYWGKDGRYIGEKAPSEVKKTRHGTEIKGITIDLSTHDIQQEAEGNK